MFYLLNTLVSFESVRTSTKSSFQSRL